MTPGPSQLPLSLSHQPQLGRDSFIPAPSNQAALAIIERWPDWPSRTVVLSGPLGSGKTHLARIWADLAHAETYTAASLENANLARQGVPLVVEDMPMDGIREQALFHLINTVSEAGTSLLLTSRLPASDWQIALPDLQSRLRLAAPAQLHAPDDDLLRQVLVKLMSDRQLIVDKPVLDYLLVRMERSLSAAASLVERLDREALASSSAITRPLAARVLAGTGDDPAPDGDGEFPLPQ